MTQPRTLVWLLVTLLLLLLALVLLNWRQWRHGRRLSRRLDGAGGAGDADPALAAGLVSRAQFDLALEAAAAQADHARRSVCVLFVNLDHFRSVNDVGGYGDGDRVLAQAAQRLRAVAGVRVTL